MLTVQFVEKNIKPIKAIIKNRYTIENVHFNSQSIEKNGMFFAFTQGQRNGHLFIDNAIENGATTIILSDSSFISYDNDINYFLVEDTFESMWKLAEIHRDTLEIPMIAITGSNGKTTTKDILYHILSDSNKVFKTPKNLNNHIGVPLNLLNVDNTFDYVILELGMNHPGEIDTLAKLVKPFASLITNIGESHIEFLGSTENIAKAKGEIIPHTSENGFLVLNDSIHHKDILTSVDTTKTTYFVSSINNDVDLSATNIQNLSNGTSFKIEGVSFYIPLKGFHNVQNTLLAIFTARKLGFNMQRIKNALSNITLTGMRYEQVDTPHKAVIINDAYNASPTSVKASVNTFVHEKGQKIIVLGDIFELGTASETLHKELGLFLNESKDNFQYLITIGKDSIFIHNEYNGAKVHFNSIEEATSFIEKFLNQDVHILFKASRGMHLEKIIHSFL